MTAPNRFTIGLLAFLALAAPCFSQGRVSEFLGVQNWHGSVTITGTGSGVFGDN
jgi:hypothetical protein